MGLIFQDEGLMGIVVQYKGSMGIVVGCVAPLWEFGLLNMSIG